MQLEKQMINIKIHLAPVLPFRACILVFGSFMCNFTKIRFKNDKSSSGKQTGYRVNTG
jgi:hypothetical protein